MSTQPVDIVTGCESGQYLHFWSVMEWDLLTLINTLFKPSCPPPPSYPPAVSAWMFAEENNPCQFVCAFHEFECNLLSDQFLDIILLVISWNNKVCQLNFNLLGGGRGDKFEVDDPCITGEWWGMLPRS